MSENVVPLFEGNALNSEPVTAIVEMLERYLKEAQNGDIRAIAVAVSYNSTAGNIATAFQWEHGHGFTLLAAGQLMLSRLITRVGND